jgi:hypothetical protein
MSSEGIILKTLSQDRFDEIKEGLLDWVLDKTIVTEEKFNQITKKVRAELST